MLNVTILKTKHYGEDEAKKLLPYFKQADAFSLENLGLTEEGALRNDGVWLQILNSNLSRTKFLSDTLNWLSNTYSDKNQIGYYFKAYDYAFRSRVPLYSSERWMTKEEAKNIESYLFNTEFDNGIDLIIAGKQEEGIQLAYKGIVEDIRLIDMRDKNIVDNLERAEAILRAIYNLKSKENINLFIQLGSLHSPEKFSHKKLEVVNLFDTPSEGERIQLDIIKLVSEGKSIDDLVPVFNELAAYRNSAY